VVVTKESRRQKDAEGREHPARQDVGGIVVSEVQCREDHEGDRGEGAPDQARRESKHIVDADRDRGDVAAGESVALDSLQGFEEVPDWFGDKETGQLRSVRGRQGESGPESRDCHVVDECDVVGQEKSHDAQVEGPFVFAGLPVLEGPEQYDGKDVVHRISNLEEIGEPGSADSL
jgi:hypothetical protein